MLSYFLNFIKKEKNFFANCLDFLFPHSYASTILFFFTGLRNICVLRRANFWQ